MTRPPFRTAWLLLAAASVSCTPGPTPPAPADTVAQGATCRVGPDGGPLVAERGIGGTGAPATFLAERGIGGTGIVGVITGFGSVCVGGEEVALGGGVPVTVDDAAADPAALRAGQLVALDAAGSGGTLSARRVQVRHEVSGPVESATAERLRVAGQDVALTSSTWMGGGVPKAGDWVAVSGLRRPDGTLEATRIDPRPPGPVLVHGTLVRNGTRLRIGGLTVSAEPGAAGLVGREVTASGVLLGAELAVTSLQPDRLATDPAGYFGVGVTALLVEGFVVADGGELRIGRATLRAGPGFGAVGPGGPGFGAAGRSVVAFSRTQAGRFEAVGTRTPGADRGFGTFAPAPGTRGAGSGFGAGPGERGFGSGNGERGFGNGDRRQERTGLNNGGAGPGDGGPGTGGPGAGGPGAGGPGTGGPGAGGFGPGGGGRGSR